MGAPPIPLLFGPMLIGVFLNTILYGILVMQMAIYVQTRKRDPAWIRLFILFLFIAETINTILDMHMIYEPLVLRYATHEAITFFPTMLAADPALTVIISTPVQIFVAWRIRIISKATWLSAIIVLLALTAFGGGIWLTVTVTQIRRFVRKPELHWPALLWLVTSAVVDIIITASLVFHLSRRKTGFSSTDSAISKIIRLTIQTGMVTAIFATLDVVCFLVLPHTTINFVWDFALGKLYTNALMSTLNARAGFARVANGPVEHNLLFGTEPQSAAPRGIDANRMSINLQFHNQNSTFEAGRYTSETYEMESTSTKRPPSTSDLENRITIDDPKEVNTTLDSDLWTRPKG